MSRPNWSLPYPRRRLQRFLLRSVLRPLLFLLFKVEISGQENFPRNGPLLVVGNHTGAMEVVLLNALAPWQIEMLSAADMPTEKITEIINRIYGSIPIRRGAYDRQALSAALDVLSQDGIVGLFPEGGVWEAGKQKALPGISWLSYRSGAAILPIGFNNTAGALNAGLKLKRPSLKMYVGQVLPPARIPEGRAKKAYFQEHAAEAMQAVYDLVPVDDLNLDSDISAESFELEIRISGPSGQRLELPAQLRLQHGPALAKLLHRPAILEIFIINLELPTQALQQLADAPPLADLLGAVEAVLNYLEEENPYLLTYRFGIPEGLAMQAGIQELHQILLWCSDQANRIRIKPIRRYISASLNEEIIQTEQETTQPWM